MAILKINGDTSGSVSLTVPAVAGTNTATVPAQTGTLEMLGSGTAVTASGTSVDFTSIPSWVKRITVMFSGVSTTATSNYLLQIGSGSIVTSGYSSRAVTESGTSATSTAGLILTGAASANATTYGSVTLFNVTGNTWTSSGIVTDTVNRVNTNSGGIVLSGVLDRIRITTVNGTDTFDAGSINILYEG